MVDKKLAGSFNTLWSNYRRKAKNRGHEWKLTREQFYSLTQGNCTYCSLPPLQKVWNRNPKLSYKYNGIDRMNNELGYTAKNCVPCCKECNQIKGPNLTFEEMHAAVAAIKRARFRSKPGPTD